MIFASGIAAALLLFGTMIFFLFFWKREADPYALLEEATCLSEENLCLTAILKQEPNHPKYRDRLLKNYRTLGADTLTILAALGDLDTEPSITESAPEEAGTILAAGGIISNGRKYTEIADGGSVASAGDTTYFATERGIYADFKGLKVLISPARADCLYAAENGLYYLNVTEKRIQYIARDGHKTKTISPIKAQSFTFFEDTLWAIGTDGTLYRDKNPIGRKTAFRTISAAGDRLYAEGFDYKQNASLGLFLWEGKHFKQVTFSPIRDLTAGIDGNAYFLNEGQYPARYAPNTAEITLLAKEQADAIQCDRNEVYYLDGKKKIKKS